MQDYSKIITPTKKKNTLSKGAKQGLTLFIILTALVIGLIVAQIIRGNFSFSSFTPNISTSANLTDIVEDTASSFSFNRNASIAVLSIEGVIQNENESYNQRWLLETIENLTYDSSNAAILLYIDSPGGGVYQSDDVYLALEEYKEVSGKPIWAYFGPIAASGGYYIGCAAETIYANRNTLTGSIGVISSSSIDITELMDAYGIKMTTITAGRNKNMMNINSPLTEEQRAIMQSIADEAYDQFTSIVAESRGMDIEYVQELADGRIYTALQAEKNGLIDAVGSFEDTIIDMEINLFEGEDMYVEYYQYEKEEISFLDLLLDFSSTAKTIMFPKEAATLEAIQSSLGLPTEMEYPAYYYHK